GGSGVGGGGGGVWGGGGGAGGGGRGGAGERSERWRAGIQPSVRTFAVRGLAARSAAWSKRGSPSTRPPSSNPRMAYASVCSSGCSGSVKQHQGSQPFSVWRWAAACRLRAAAALNLRSPRRTPASASAQAVRVL